MVLSKSHAKGGKDMKKEYYIKLSDGQVVPVTEEVYREYKRPQWREAKQKKVRQMREFFWNI